MKPNAMVINPKDNVAVALTDLKKGESIAITGNTILTALCDIPFSHKIALKDLESGERIIKYGEAIGRAGEEIRAGDMVHTHNMAVED